MTIMFRAQISNRYIYEDGQFFDQMLQLYSTVIQNKEATGLSFTIVCKRQRSIAEH